MLSSNGLGVQLVDKTSRKIVMNFCERALLCFFLNAVIDVRYNENLNEIEDLTQATTPFRLLKSDHKLLLRQE